jgi:hypothetical protein
VGERDIERAIERRRRYATNPKVHRYVPGING